MKKFLIGVSSALVGLVLFASPALAADLTVGNDTAARTVTDTRADFAIVDTNQPANFTGNLTEFDYYASTTNPFRFLVVEDGSNTIKWVSDEITPPNLGVNSFSPVSPVHVETGWNVGMYFVSTGTIPFDWVGAPASYTSGGYGVPVVGTTLIIEAASGRTYSFVANGNYTLNWGSKVNAGACTTKVGKPVINVTQKVINDVDSGFNGYWAFDNNNRQIQVWKTSAPPAGENSTYCAVVRYEGQFDAQAGTNNSPGTVNVTSLTGNEDGAFEGGYNATIVGSLNLSPTYPTTGTIGPFDYACEINTGSCPGYVSWVNEYFSPSPTFTYNWWGWVYHGGSHGTWINSSDGSFGNIN